MAAGGGKGLTMIRLSVAIADTHALEAAFVVWRGFEASFSKAKAAGYDGVELALRRAGEISLARLDRLLSENGLTVSAVSTGQVFADGGLCLTDENPERRGEALAVLQDLADFAGDYGKTLNLGRVRGSIASEKSEAYFCEAAARLCEQAQKRGVTVILEPVNRYEINFINNLDEGAQLLRKLKIPNFKLMPDLFHMNIEDDRIGDSLRRSRELLHYIHFADSNRLAPGRGHLDFYNIFSTLAEIKYDGWISVEILPKPDPDTAAGQAAAFLRPRISRYNSMVP
jgi:sugar phosphate isomerase/epimerase